MKVIKVKRNILERPTKTRRVLPCRQTMKNRGLMLKDRMTVSERRFFDRAKEHGIHLKPQVVLGLYIVDFRIPMSPVVIEIDGSAHDNRQQYDARRDDWLNDCGFIVWRVPNQDVETFDMRQIADCPQWSWDEEQCARQKATWKREKFRSHLSGETYEPFVYHPIQPPRKQPKIQKETRVFDWSTGEFQ